MMDKGTIFKFYNDLDTDQIIASQYLLLPNLEEMKAYTFESQDLDFAKRYSLVTLLLPVRILAAVLQENRLPVC